MKSFARYISESRRPKQKLPDLSGVQITKVPMSDKTIEAGHYSVPYYRVIGMDYDICWYLSRPTPEHFINMVRNHYFRLHNPSDTHKSIKSIDDWSGEEYAGTDGIVYHILDDAMAINYWFGQHHDAYKEMIEKAFTKMISCPSRAKWLSSPSMKGYRGIRRELADIKKYSYTGEVYRPTGSPVLFAIAKQMYKSKSMVQSWSDSMIVAHNYGTAAYYLYDGDSYPTHGNIATMMSAEIDGKEILFSPKIASIISTWGNEREIVRVSRKPLPVTIYVSIKDVVKMTGGPVRDMKAAQAIARGTFGMKAGDRLMKNPEFRKELGIG